jgi:hypothetical protein
MAIDLIDVGATANDGSGDSIRAAFQTVNSNFDFVNGGLFAGSEATTISAVSVTGGVIVSNTSVTANSTTSNNVIVTGALGGNLFVQSNGAYIIGNVNIIGNLNVSGTQAAAQAQSSTASLLNLHYSASPFLLNDNRDIGLVWQYYTAGPEKKAFLGWQNSTESLVYWDNITENISNVITAGTPGNVQIGSLLIANSTIANSNVSGALKIIGGASVGGNLYVAANLVSTFANIANLAVTGYHVGNMYFAGADTIYINGSPVQTAAQSFNGGTIGLLTTFNDITQSTSAVTGAVQVRGGLGVAGNIWAGNIHANIGGNVRANIQGNIFTPAQPFITSLGTLTGLSVQGQINTRDIIPDTNLTYNIGSSGSTRYNKIWAYDTDFSGAMTLAGEITSTANININRVSVAGIQTTTTIAEIFNTGATTVRIGSAGTTEFDSNTQSTSTTTGAVVIRGGLSLTSGNVHIGGSAGTSLTATGNIVISGNILPTNGNITHNLGSSTAWWSNVWAGTFRGESITARYADLAEIYKSDTSYEYGTVVIFGGSQEITTTNEQADVRVAGVISQNPAYLMNSSEEGLPVALRGRVPVRLVGPVSKGDLLVTSTIPGYAKSVGRDNSYGSAVFAKSLDQDYRNGTKIIEAVIL